MIHLIALNAYNYQIYVISIATEKCNSAMKLDMYKSITKINGFQVYRKKLLIVQFYR
jgi:hypothetical protein